MKEFQKKVQQQFDLMCATGKLFRADVSGKAVYDAYLESFKPDAIFRDPTSSVHNCNTCNNFIRRYGNVVAIDEKGELMSIFDVKIEGEFENTAKKLTKLITSAKIKDVFFETIKKLHDLPYEAITKGQEVYLLGVISNHKRYTKGEADAFKTASGEYIVKPNEIRTFDHLCVTLPKQFVDIPERGAKHRSIEQIMAEYRDKFSVFKRAMTELSLDTLILVKDLIKQGSLLDGEAHLHAIEEVIAAHTSLGCDIAYYGNTLDNWFWQITYNMEERVAKFKNTLIGVLCTELSEGLELNAACKNWNIRVDPVNYHKVTAPITQKQIEEAQKFVIENDYVKSFERRIAIADDINVSEIKHIASSTEKTKMKLFENVKSTSTQHKRSEFDGIEEVSIEKFMQDILPGCTSIEAYLENKMNSNLVVLTTAEEKESKKMFKWGNNYSWTFSGNLAGKSQIKEAVKAQGGGVDGVLRFSIMWAEDDGDNSDLDAHCVEPDSNIIKYKNKVSNTGGTLDIDITQPQSHKSSGKKVVENITYPSTEKMKDGIYTFYVHQFSARNSRGFKAEIEVNGEIYSYERKTALTGRIPVAEVTLKQGVFTIKHIMVSSSVNISKKIWNIETNNFHKVNLVCLSPNHWGENAVGNKHYLFMLDNCKVDVPVRSFHNENLTEDLLKHKKVMEVLGATNMIMPQEKQLAGIGFNSTTREELIIKCQGSFKRTVKIKF